MVMLIERVMDDMICKYCGHRMVENNGFCTKCGRPVKSYGKLTEKLPEKMKPPVYLSDVKTPDNNTNSIKGTTIIAVTVSVVTVIVLGLIILRLFGII